MKESIPTNSNQELYQKELQEHSLRVGEALLQANLIIPQTYGAIRVLGAESILAETSTEYDFSPRDLLDGIEKQLELLAEKFTAQMIAGHKASGVEFGDKNKSLEDTSNAQIRIKKLIRSHFEIALAATGDALAFCEDYFNEKDESTIQLLAVEVISIFKESLLDESLRSQLIEYRKRVALDNLWKNSYAQRFAQAWFVVWMQKLKISRFAPNTVKEQQIWEGLFYRLTDSSDRPYVLSRPNIK